MPYADSTAEETVTTKRILLVEDEFILASNEAEKLKKYNFDVVTANTPDEAFESLEREEFDLILMDIDLGEGVMDGADTAARILERKELPIVFFTGHAEKEMVDRVKDVARYGYVLKNSGEFVLVESITTAFELFETQRNCRRKEENFRGLVESAGLGIIVLQDEEVKYANPSAAEITGYSRAEIRRCDPARMIELIYPEDRERLEEIYRDHFKRFGDYINRSRSLGSIECRMTRKDGSVVWAECFPSVFTYDGKPALLVMKTDITEKKHLQERHEKIGREKGVLLKEINHRVKNNLLMITSLINLKESALGGTVDLSDLNHQVDTIRIIHEKLLHSEDLSHIDLRDYTRDLLVSIFSSFHRRPVKVHNTVPSVSIPTKTAIPLGLIINELATNTLKHAFVPPEKHPEPGFTIDLTEVPERGEYVLTLSNNGNPFPPGVSLDNPETLGLRLVSGLVKQLRGSIELVGKPHPVFTIRFPMTVD
ncbi:MAG: sensor histidine kinase [Spirochaetia bacterium]